MTTSGKSDSKTTAASTATECAASPGSCTPQVPQIPDHEVLHRIGSGSYGEVWSARNVMGTHRAVKVVYRDRFKDEGVYEREFRGLRMFEPVSRQHDDLIDILQVGRNDALGCYYYVMELADNMGADQSVESPAYRPRTLSEEISNRGRLPIEECVRLALSLVDALKHLHGHQLIHRDIKPSNIVFINGRPKIADIGLVTKAGEASSQPGTPGYIAPEGPGTPAADIFSLGKVLYEISTGKDRLQFPEAPTTLESGESARTSQEFSEIVRRACAHDPRQRYTSAEALESDLLLLRAGRSVRRLHLAEKRLALLTRVGAVAAVLMLAVMFHFSQQRGLTRRSLANSYVSYGTHVLDQHDLLGALPSYAAALVLERRDSARANRHRVRLGVGLRQCPKLVQMWFLPVAANSVSFSPDGERLVAACNVGQVYVLEIGTDQPRLLLEGHARDGYVENAAFSPDGTMIVSAGEDGTARIWDAQTGDEIADRSPLRHRWRTWEEPSPGGVAPMPSEENRPVSVYSARFSPGSDSIVTACADGGVRIWRLDQPQAPSLCFHAHHDAVSSAAFSPDGSKLVTSSLDNTARLWDAVTGAPLHATPLTHDHWVYDAAFSPQGHRVVTVSYDKTARVWDVDTGRLTMRLNPETPMCSVQYSADGSAFAAVCWNFSSATRIWNETTGRETFAPLRHTGYRVRVAWGPNARRIAIAGADGIIRVWDLAGNAWQPPTAPVLFSLDGRRKIIGTDHGFEIGETGRDAPTRSQIRSDNPLPAALLSRNGRWLLSARPGSERAGAPRHAQVWDADNGRPLGPEFTLRGESRAAALGPNGTRAVVGTEARAELWDTVAGTPLHTWTHEAPVSGVDFSPTGERVVIWSKSSTNVFLWDATKGTQVSRMPHLSLVGHAEFSPDGRHLVTCCTPGQLQRRYAEIWDAQSGTSTGIRLWHGDGVNQAAFSPNGRRVVTASEDRTARIWDSATGAALTPPLIHRDQVRLARFSPDGHWLATISQDESVRVWDAATGEPVTPGLPHDFSVQQLQFTNDRRALFCTSTPGNFLDPAGLSSDWRVWDLSPDPRSADQLTAIAEILSGRQGAELGAGLLIDRDTLERAWRELRAAAPADFSVSPDEIRAWHLGQARNHERAGSWFAARFHLERVAKLLPDDPQVARRLARAEAELGRTHSQSGG